MHALHTKLCLVLLLQVTSLLPASAGNHSYTNTKNKEVMMDTLLPSNRKMGKDHAYFIDQFLVPANARQEFIERTTINRQFIKTLPGFIEDAAYERTDEQGNTVFVTVAVWESKEALDKAKEAVQAEYKKQGFNPQAMMERLHITMNRGIYTLLHD